MTTTLERKLLARSVVREEKQISVVGGMCRDY